MDSDCRPTVAGQMLPTLTGGALSMLVSVGYRTGLFEAAARGPATTADLAERAGLQERYVREWLGAMVTGGVFRYHPATGQYALPPRPAQGLPRDTATHVAPLTSMLPALPRAPP